MKIAFQETCRLLDIWFMARVHNQKQRFLKVVHEKSATNSSAAHSFELAFKWLQQRSRVALLSGPTGR